MPVASWHLRRCAHASTKAVLGVPCVHVPTTVAGATRCSPTERAWRRGWVLIRACFKEVNGEVFLGLNACGCECLRTSMSGRRVATCQSMGRTHLGTLGHVACCWDILQGAQQTSLAKVPGLHVLGTLRSRRHWMAAASTKHGPSLICNRGKQSM